MYSSGYLLNPNTYIYLVLLTSIHVMTKPIRFDIPDWLYIGNGQSINKIDIPIFKQGGVGATQRQVHVATPRIRSISAVTSLDRNDFYNAWKNYFYQKKGKESVKYNVSHSLRNCL